MDRRTYLFAAGGTLAALSGCVQSGEGTSGGDEDGSETADSRGTEPVSLGAVDGPGTWPQVAHDERNSSYAPGAAGPRGEVEVAWEAFGDRSVFRPVVDGDLYFTENWTAGAAVSLDGEDGSERWANFSLPPMRWAPALRDDQLFAITRSETNEVTLHSLDAATGEERWGRSITASSSSHPETGPTVAGDRVYVGSDTGTLALDAASGDVVWQADLDEHVVEVEDGPTRLTVWATPAVSDDRVYTFDRNDAYEGTRTVYAVDGKTGEPEWTADIELPDGWYLDGHVVVGRDRVFVTVLDPHIAPTGDDSDWSGTQRVYALDAASGDEEWWWELEGKTLGPPAYAEGVLFVGEWMPDADTGRLHAVDASDRSAFWTYETDAGGVDAPAVTPETVYVRQGQELAGLAVADGSLDWRLPFDESLSAPVVAGDSVYALVGGRRDQDDRVVAVRSR